MKTEKFRNIVNSYPRLVLNGDLCISGRGGEMGKSVLLASGKRDINMIRVLGRLFKKND